MKQLDKWKIFLSSTSKDLHDVRDHITQFLRTKGIEVIRFEDNFIKDVNKNSQQICIDNVRNADFFILVLDCCCGEKYNIDNSISITQAEFREAKKNNIPYIFFISERLKDEYFNLIGNINAKNQKKVIKAPVLKKHLRTYTLIDNNIETDLLFFTHELMSSNEGNYASFFSSNIDIEKEMLSRLKDFSFSIYRKIISAQTDLLLGNGEFGRTLKGLLGGYYTKPEVRKIPDYDGGDIDLSKTIPPILEEKRYVIIQGKAGAGKTTELIRAYLNDSVDENNYMKKMKLYVRLKDLPINEFGIVDPLTIINYQIENILGRGPYEFLYGEVNFHLYFDGLDEIATDPREKDIKIYVNASVLKHSLALAGRVEIGERVRNILLQQDVSLLVYEVYEWDNKKANIFLTKTFASYPSLIEELEEEHIQKKIVDLIKNPLIATMFAFIIHENDLKWPVDVDNQASLFDIFIDRWLNRELVRLSINSRSFSKSKKDIRKAWRITAWELYQLLGSNRLLKTDQLIETIILLQPNISKKLLGNIFESLLIKSRISDVIKGFIHEQFMEYFIAELFVDHCLNNDEAVLSYLEKAIRGDVNDFIRAIWDRFEDRKVVKIFETLKSLYYNQAVDNIQMQANIIYYMSRIPMRNLRDQVKDFFEKASYSTHMFISNGALYSLVRLGDFSAEERLYHSLSTSKEAASYNRRLHLEYYADVLPSPNPPTFDDEVSLWGRCCKELLEHLYDNRDKFIYTKRVDIFTIRDLMSSRQHRGSLDHENLEQIHKSLMRLKKERPAYIHIVDKAMVEYCKLKELWESLSISG